MTLSTFSRDNLIIRALRICGVVADGQNPSPTQISTGATVLQEVLNELRTEGFDRLQISLIPTVLVASSEVTNGGTNYTCILPHTSGATTEPGVGAEWTVYWRIAGSSGTPWVTATAYTAIGVISLGSTVDDVLLVTLRNTDGSDETPLTPWDFSEYQKWRNKGDTGKPFAFYAEFSQPRKLYLAHQPDSATAYVLMVLAVTDLTLPSGATSVSGKESFWDSAIAYKLAASLSDEYGLPLSERQWLLTNAMAKIAKAKGKDDRNTGARFSGGAY